MTAKLEFDMTSAVKQQDRRLGAARRAAGHTQESLAELLGVDRTTVARWERGTRHPHPWFRPKLAAALHVSQDRLAVLLFDPVVDVREQQVYRCGDEGLTVAARMGVQGGRDGVSARESDRIGVRVRPR